MADARFELDVFRDVLDDAAVLGELVKDERQFQALYEAYRKGDRREFQAILERLHLVQRCGLICEWIGAKECTFVCFELCGPPPPADRALNPRELAEAIAKLTGDAAAMTQLAEAVEKRDRAAFARLVEAYKLGAFCHFFCHWICYVRYRLICRWLCTPSLETRPGLVEELQAAGRALRALLERPRAFEEAVAASNAGDAEKLRAVIEGAGLLQFCYLICFFFCSWHCVLVCLRLCRQFPPEPIRDQIKEALEFAKEIQKLGDKRTELSKLVAAVGAGDDRTFAAMIGELGLKRYCLQLCHWLCFRRCRRFCILVCPPIDTIPLFTHVGAYHVDPIYGDFQADGTTTAGGYAFTRDIPLIGILPGWEAANQ